MAEDAVTGKAKWLRAIGVWLGMQFVFGLVGTAIAYGELREGGHLRFPASFVLPILLFYIVLNGFCIRRLRLSMLRREDPERFEAATWPSEFVSFMTVQSAVFCGMRVSVLYYWLFLLTALATNLLGILPIGLRYWAQRAAMPVRVGEEDPGTGEAAGS